MSETKKKLTRTDVINMVCEKHPEFIKLGIKTIVNSAFDALADAIVQGGLVEIRRLGVFSIKQLQPRKSRNPKTGQTILAKSFKGVKYKVSKEIKNKLKEHHE